MTNRYEARPYRNGTYAVKDLDTGNLIVDAAGEVVQYPPDVALEVARDLNEAESGPSSGVMNGFTVSA